VQAPKRFAQSQCVLVTPSSELAYVYTFNIGTLILRHQSNPFPQLGRTATRQPRQISVLPPILRLVLRLLLKTCSLFHRRLVHE
jgi:hypothetical protein